MCAWLYVVECWWAGSGLHTFVLYLGPHIALFTIRATQCGRVDLKCAPYDTPQFGLASSWQTKDCSLIGPPMYPRLVADGLDLYMVPLHKVLLQVQLEAVLWGLGTTLGELPPYFVSRAGLSSFPSLTTSKKSLVLNFSRLQWFSYQFFWLGFRHSSVEILVDCSVEWRSQQISELGINEIPDLNRGCNGFSNGKLLHQCSTVVRAKGEGVWWSHEPRRIRKYWPVWSLETVDHFALSRIWLFYDPPFCFGILPLPDSNCVALLQLVWIRAL